MNDKKITLLYATYVLALSLFGTRIVFHFFLCIWFSLRRRAMREHICVRECVYLGIVEGRMKKRHYITNYGNACKT